MSNTRQSSINPETKNCDLRARTGRTLFTAIAVALGVALIFARRIVGVDLEISSATRVNFSAWPLK